MLKNVKRIYYYYHFPFCFIPIYIFSHKVYCQNNQIKNHVPFREICVKVFQRIRIIRKLSSFFNFFQRINSDRVFSTCQIDCVISTYTCGCKKKYFVFFLLYLVTHSLIALILVSLAHDSHYRLFESSRPTRLTYKR